MLKRLKRYWNPRSLTWWTGTTLVTSGVMQIYGLSIPGVTEIVRPVISAMYEGMPPGGLISAGLGLWGLGGKLDALKSDMGIDGHFRPGFEDLED